MYKIEVDKSKKLIKAVLSGFVKEDEMVNFYNEIKAKVFQFSAKEPYVLSDMSDFKPASPEVAQILQKVVGELTPHCRKIASVHKSALTQMQLKRLGDESKANDVIRRFPTEEEAIKYLFE